MARATTTITAINYQGIRKVLYGCEPTYRIIAFSNADVTVGDTIEYDAETAVGWFVRVVQKGSDGQRCNAN